MDDDAKRLCAAFGGLHRTRTIDGEDRAMAAIRRAVLAEPSVLQRRSVQRTLRWVRTAYAFKSVDNYLTFCIVDFNAFCSFNVLKI